MPVYAWKGKTTTGEIESGEVTAQLTRHDGREIRLRTICAGTIVGELGLILNEPRTASVIAECPSVVYRLSKDALERMQVEDSRMAISFHRFLTHLLAERLTKTDRAIQTVLS